MERLDLEVFEASLDAGVLLDLTHWRGLVAELRAAREVVEQARPYVVPRPPEGRSYPPLGVALDAYDQAAKTT